MSHALKTDTAPASAKAVTGSVDHELRDGTRVIAVGRRSEVMRAAVRVSHGATVGRIGDEPSFLWSAAAGGWVFLSV